MDFLHRTGTWIFTLALVFATALAPPDGWGSPTMKTTDTLLPLIPAPLSWQAAEGVFQLKDVERIVSVAKSMDSMITGAQAATRLASVLDRDPIITSTGPGGHFKGALVLEMTPDAVPEQYELRITAHSIHLSAGDAAGFHHGLSTLIQLGVNGAGTLPCGVIYDRPRFGWRGMLLDCGRHFMSVEAVKDVLDKLALHKFNVLHWHLTEDQGWRLEIPGYPRLTEVGAWRTEPDGTVHGGFYTAADVREVLAHAFDRGITVVPEIEMPGHCQAALAAYPGLSCTGGPFEVQTQWGIHEDVFCAGREATFTFLEKVLDYVGELFPGTYIHIGGDEVPKDRWRACDYCQERIRQEGLKDEDDLQSWFIGRIGKFLASRDRKLIGWDEILTGGLPGDPAVFTVQAWRGIEEATAAARQGHDVIVSPTSHAYFDYDPGILDLQKVFAFRPVPRDLEDAALAHILGGQMNLWTEYIPEARIDAMLFPRLTAMAEALWTGTEGRDFSEFLDRLDRHGPVLDLLNVVPGAAARPLVISGARCTTEGAHLLDIRVDPRVENAFAGQELVVKFALVEPPLSFDPAVMPEDQGLPGITFANGTWSDGQEIFPPGSRASSGLIQAGLFINGRPYGAPALMELRHHAARDADITFRQEPSERYPGGGPRGLIDGLHGSRYFQDGLWTGFEGHDLDATLDLGRVAGREEISLRFLQDANAWVFLPSEVGFYISEDGNTWIEVGVVRHRISNRKQEKVIREFRMEVGGARARYIRVRAENPEVCPSWHPGRGRPCWLFADEIVVR